MAEGVVGSKKGKGGGEARYLQIFQVEWLKVRTKVGALEVEMKV